MTIWQVSREYAGIAEAGGVKNVVRSLSEGFTDHGYEVTAFLPFYGCTIFSSLDGFSEIPGLKAEISVDGRRFTVTYASATLDGVHIIFVLSPVFQEKLGVYTYTELEERKDSSHRRGEGHKDASLMEMLFQHAVLQYGVLVPSAHPDMVICHDATCAFIPALARETVAYAETYASSRFFTTIHNAGPYYHHEIASLSYAHALTSLPMQVLEKGFTGEAVEPYFLAGFYSKLITVSPYYAHELMDPSSPNTQGLAQAFARSHMHITGITNGIDYQRYDPSDIRISGLSYPFSPKDSDFEGKRLLRRDFIQRYNKNDRSEVSEAIPMTPEDDGLPPDIVQFGSITEGKVIFSFHGRLAYQKGVDILVQAIPDVLSANPDARFVITGQGSSDLETSLIKRTQQFPGKVLYLRGYEKTVARETVAISDFLVLPSHFEPCGLEDFIGSIYGTIPVAHSTGGLRKIQDGKTGFLFEENTSSNLAHILTELAEKLVHSPDGLSRIRTRAAQTVHDEYNWNTVIENGYIPLMEGACKEAQDKL